MPQYGLEYGRVVGISALLLCTDLPPQQKEPLLINLVQVGIDLGGMVRAGHPGWTGWGGHGSGRKLPIVLAGLLLGDESLAHVNQSFPKVSFGEDEQTAYGDCWTGAKVVFAGHSGIDAATGAGRQRGSGWGPYEHLPPVRVEGRPEHQRIVPPLLHERRLGRTGPGPETDARRDRLGPRRLFRLRRPLDARGRRRLRQDHPSKRPAGTTTRNGRGRARLGTPLSTRCGPSTGRRCRLRPTAGSTPTTTATTGAAVANSR